MSPIGLPAPRYLKAVNVQNESAETLDLGLTKDGLKKYDQVLIYPLSLNHIEYDHIKNSYVYVDPILSVNLKKCNKCGEWKTVFHFDSTSLNSPQVLNIKILSDGRIQSNLQ